VIRIRNLARDFRGKRIFGSEALEAPERGLVALRGSNGSGKTTLLRMLSTLTLPSQGDAWIGASSVVSEPARARARLGFVAAGEGGMFRRLTGRENLMLFAGLHGLSARDAARAIARWREAFALPFESALDCPFGQASSGMRQSLLLCRALLHEPQVLLLDEPARALDPQARTALWKTLARLSSEKTILFSSHDEAEWEKTPHLWQISGGVLSCST
jgi:ABC-type multidrug transport system ATPase subunit